MKLPTQLIVFLTLLTIPFANYKLVQIFGIPIYLTEVFVAILFLDYIIKSHKEGVVIQNEKMPRWLIYATSVLLAGLLISIFSNHPSATQFGILKAWFLFPLLFGWLLSQTIKTQKALRLFIFAWLISFLAITIIALGYSLSGQFTYDHRLKAFYLSPNHLALFVLPSIFIIKYHFFSAPRESKSSQFRYLFLAFCLVSMLFILFQTKSYTTFLSIASTMLLSLSFLHRKHFSIRKYALMLATLSIIITGYIMMQWDTQKFQDSIHISERSSLASRIMIWRTSAALIKDHPFAGIGPGNFQEKYLEYQKFYPPYLEWAVPQPHSLYLAFWLQTGIFGIIGFIILIFFWMQNLATCIRSGNKSISIASILLYEVILATLIAGLTDTPYWKNDLAYTFWIVITLGIILKNIQQKIPEIHPEPLNLNHETK